MRGLFGCQQGIKNMRQVTKQVKAAFFAGKSKTVGNTHTDGVSVYLHGNCIIHKREDGIYATLAGWNTPTTRERINGITGAGFHQKKRLPFLNGSEVSTTDWHKVLDYPLQG